MNHRTIAPIGSTSTLNALEISQIRDDFNFDWGTNIADDIVKGLCDRYPDISGTSRVTGLSHDTVRRLFADAVAVKFMGRTIPTREERVISPEYRNFEMNMVAKINRPAATKQQRVAHQTMAAAA